MVKYIDAEKLIHNLEERIFAYSEGYAEGDDNRKDAIETLLKDVKYQYSLQQEQEKSKKDCNDCPYCVDRKDQYGWHFKGCFGGQYKGKFIAEIDECPLKQEQQEVDLEKEVDACWQNWLSPSNQKEVEGVLPKTEFAMYAHHFYEFGRKQVLQEIYDGKTKPVDKITAAWLDD